jgi:uncharacterized Zn finger protein (UPF0148 family)
LIRCQENINEEWSYEMTGGFCPECGTPHKSGAKFCPKCGEPLASPPSTGAGTLEKASEVVDKVSSTVSKVESTIHSAGKITQTAKQLSTITIRPPAEWKVVVGEVLPVAGQKVVDTAVSTAKQQVEQKVRGEVSKQITEKIGTQKKSEAVVPRESVVAQQRIPDTMPGPPCPSCGKQGKSGAKFCGSCGARMGVSASSPPAAPHSPACPRCGAAIAVGKKFCGSCGQKLV